MEEGELAHWTLLAKIGPNPDSRKTGHIHDMNTLKKRWPPGSRWNNPNLTKKATFAYNPGPKTRANAWYKAFVRYGPSEGEKHMFRHLLDLARVTLVFSDAVLLCAGLQDILD